ncbi:TIGR02679 domain-containing protein [Streptomyces sp. NPDC051014]|uniref:TIGR02679 domain-containing protein n=1 Tax=Streptomyces sp. NPDC051014 TaxID=3155751 RepID=UPI0033EAEEFD
MRDWTATRPCGPGPRQPLHHVVPCHPPCRRLTGTAPSPAGGRVGGPRGTPGPGRTPAGFRCHGPEGQLPPLDDGTRLSTLVLHAAAAFHDTAPPEAAADPRALWTRAGVAADELSLAHWSHRWTTPGRCVPARPCGRRVSRGRSGRQWAPRPAAGPGRVHPRPRTGTRRPRRGEPQRPRSGRLSVRPGLCCTCTHPAG